MRASKGEPARGAARDRDRPLWIAAYVVTLAGAGAAVAAYRSIGGAGFPLDDSWIHLAFADNLARGDGFGINGGQPTPGATSPLWVVLLAIGNLFGGGHDIWPRSLGTACLAACGILGVSLCRRLGLHAEDNRVAPILAAVCGLSVVTCFPLVWSAAGAMEPPLFGAMLLGTMLALSHKGDGSLKTAAIWGVSAGLTANARPEGLLIIPLAAAADLLLGRGEPRLRLKRAALGVLVAVALTLPYILFCLSTTGRPFPNTYYAKTLSTRTTLPDPAYVVELVGLACQLAAEPMVGALLVFGAIALWLKSRDAAAPAAGLAFAIILPLSYATMERSMLFAGGAGNLGRYLYPMFPPLIVLSFAALGAIAQKLNANGSRMWTPRAALLLAVIAVASGIYRTARFSETYRMNVREIDEMHVQMAAILNERLPAGALVAANDVGALACLTDLRVLDLVGIISTETLDILRPKNGTPPTDPDAALFELMIQTRPDAIVIFRDWYPGLYARLRPGLHYITEVTLQERFTAGGDRLEAYSIDWSRLERPAP